MSTTTVAAAAAATTTAPVLTTPQGDDSDEQKQVLAAVEGSGGEGDEQKQALAAVEGSGGKGDPEDATMSTTNVVDAADTGAKRDANATSTAKTPNARVAAEVEDVVMSDVEGGSDDEASRVLPRHRHKRHRHKKHHHHRKKKHKKGKRRSKGGASDHSRGEVGTDDDSSDDEGAAASIEGDSDDAAQRPTKRQRHSRSVHKDDGATASSRASSSRSSSHSSSSVVDPSRIALQPTTPTVTDKGSGSKRATASRAPGAADDASPPTVRLKKALFGRSFEAFNLLVDSNFKRNKVVTAVVVPFQDLIRVVKTIGGMKVPQAHCWIVKDYIPPCDAHIEEATEVKAAVHCGKPSNWVLKVDGHFVCDAHKPANKHECSRATLASAFSGLMIVSTNNINMAVRAHIPGFIEGDMGSVTDFALAIGVAKEMMERCWKFRDPTCKNIRVSITEDEQGGTKLAFSPQRRRLDSKKVSGLLVDSEDMRHFPATIAMPKQMNADTGVTMMLSTALLGGFADLFNAQAGSEVELTVDQMKLKDGRSHHLMGEDTELLSFTFRGGLDATASLLEASRSFFSATQVRKTEAAPSAVGASVEFATTRISLMNLDRNAIARMLSRDQARDFEPVHLVRTRYARDNLVNASKLAVTEFGGSILLFTGRDEMTPLVFSHTLPSGGILLITLGVSVLEGEG